MERHKSARPLHTACTVQRTTWPARMGAPAEEPVEATTAKAGARRPRSPLHPPPWHLRNSASCQPWHREQQYGDGSGTRESSTETASPPHKRLCTPAGQPRSFGPPQEQQEQQLPQYVRPTPKVTPTTAMQHAEWAPQPPYVQQEQQQRPQMPAPLHVTGQAPPTACWNQ